MSNKRLDEMNATELAEATKEFDAPFAFLKATPPDARMRAQIESAKRRAAARSKTKVMGRPVIGQGAQRINITIERALLKRVDAVAKKVDMKRSELIAKALEIVLGKKSEPAKSIEVPARKAS